MISETKLIKRESFYSSSNMRRLWTASMPESIASAMAVTTEELRPDGEVFADRVREIRGNLEENREEKRRRDLEKEDDDEEEEEERTSEEESLIALRL